MFFGFALLMSFERLSAAQTKAEKNQSEENKNRPKLVALKRGEPDELTYDAGTARFLVSSEDTNGVGRGHLSN